MKKARAWCRHVDTALKQTGGCERGELCGGGGGVVVGKKEGSCYGGGFVVVTGNGSSFVVVTFGDGSGDDGCGGGW